MRRAGTALAVVLVAMLFACGPKKPFAQQLSAISSGEFRVASCEPSPESRVAVASGEHQSSVLRGATGLDRLGGAEDYLYQSSLLSGRRESP
jgi:hypothetical protein